MEIRRLTGADARTFQDLRLSGLQESPTTFASSYEEERVESGTLLINGVFHTDVHMVRFLAGREG